MGKLWFYSIIGAPVFHIYGPFKSKEAARVDAGKKVSVCGTITIWGEGRSC
jgi:hypothetical protein